MSFWGWEGDIIDNNIYWLLCARVRLLKVLYLILITNLGEGKILRPLCSWGNRVQITYSRSYSLWVLVLGFECKKFNCRTQVDKYAKLHAMYIYACAHIFTHIHTMQSKHILETHTLEAHSSRLRVSEIKLPWVYTFKCTFFFN